MPSTDVERILLVESNPIVGQILQQALEDAGYDPTVTTTFLEGTDLLTTHRWQIIVVNADLPNGSGLALAEMAQQSGTKALVMTDNPRLVPLLISQRIAHLRMPVSLKWIVEHINLARSPNHNGTKFVVDYAFDLSHQRIVKSRLSFRKEISLRRKGMGAAAGKRAAPDAIFKSAYSAAVAAAGEAEWPRLPISKQSELIYQEMRRIGALMHKTSWGQAPTAETAAHQPSPAQLPD